MVNYNLHGDSILIIDIIVCLFNLKFSVPGNSNGHVGTSPPLYGTTFTHNEDILISNKCFRNRTIQLSHKGQYVWMTGLEPLFLRRLKPERLTRSRGYKTFFMLSSAETKIYPAHKC